MKLKVFYCKHNGSGLTKYCDCLPLVLDKKLVIEQIHPIYAVRKIKSKTGKNGYAITSSTENETSTTDVDYGRVHHWICRLFKTI